MRRQGMSLREISYVLNAEGVLTPAGRTHWLKSYVDRVLHTHYVQEIISEAADDCSGRMETTSKAHQSM